jgi:hypothetical protein
VRHIRKRIAARKRERPLAHRKKFGVLREELAQPLAPRFDELLIHLRRWTIGLGEE